MKVRTAKVPRMTDIIRAELVLPFSRFRALQMPKMSVPMMTYAKPKVMKLRITPAMKLPIMSPLKLPPTR